MPGGSRFSPSSLCSAVSAFMPHCAPLKASITSGARTSRLFIRRSSIPCITGGHSLRRCSFLLARWAFAPRATTTAKPTTARFSWIRPNVHRYFFYLAVLFICFLWYDGIRSFFFDGHFGVGVGTLVLTLNVMLLSLYTFSCHSLRHLAGGKLDCFSCATFGRSRFEACRLSTFLHGRHMLFAWCSLFSVGFADFYIRMVSCGAIRDLRLL